MANEIRVPTLGESVTEATAGRWFKKAGDPVAADEPLVELETDKVTLEVPAPAAGVLSEIKVKNGAVVSVGAVLATIEANGAGAKPAPVKAAPAPGAKPDLKAATAKLVEEAKPRSAAKAPEGTSPAAQKIMTERGVSPAVVAVTGKDGRITKADAVAAAQPVTRPTLVPSPAPISVRAPSPPDQAAREER